MTGLVERVTGEGGRMGLSREGWAVLLVIAVIALFPGMFSIPPMDRDESRYAQASVQMMETGDFVDIRFQEDPRHVKPAGIYWMQVVTSLPFGGVDAPIGAHRLPSFFGALFAVIATAWAGARFFNPRVGLAAGLVLACSLMLQVEARTAKTDAMLLACAAAAQIALLHLFLRVKEAKPAFRGWPAVFWAGTGLALLVKGPIVAMVSAFTLFGYVLLKRDWRLLLKLRPLPGLALAGAIFLPWFIAINLATDFAFTTEAVGHALFGKVGEADDSHGGPFGYHTLLTPLTFWPGFVLLALGGAYAWTRRREDIVQILLVWILPAWAVFELVQTKLPHYILPTAPAIALLAAAGLDHAAGLMRRGAARWVHGVLAVVAVAAGVVLSALPGGAAAYFGGGSVLWIALATLFGALATIAIALVALRPEMGRFLAAALAGALYHASLFYGVVPSLDALWPSDRARKVVETLSGCEAVRVATAGYREPSNVFHFGTDTMLGRDGAEAAQFLAQNRACGVAVVDISETEAFAAALEAAGVEVRSVGRIDGHNAVKGRDLVLSVFVAEESQLQAPG